MKDKTLAIFGAGAYILSVITSATDSVGNFVSPIFLIAISGIAMTVFTVMAVVRLWKGARYVSIILASSTIILFVLIVIQEVILPKGSSVIFLLNITKVIHFLTFIYVIFFLWAIAKYKTNDLQVK